MYELEHRCRRWTPTTSPSGPMTAGGKVNAIGNFNSSHQARGDDQRGDGGKFLVARMTTVSCSHRIVVHAGFPRCPSPPQLIGSAMLVAAGRCRVPAVSADVWLVWFGRLRFRCRWSAWAAASLWRSPASGILTRRIGADCSVSFGLIKVVTTTRFRSATGAQERLVSRTIR